MPKVLAHEPLDPLARRVFLQTRMDAAAEDGLTVLLSSHILADLGNMNIFVFMNLIPMAF